MTPYLIIIQKLYPGKLPFNQHTIKTWAKQPLLGLSRAEVTLRFVSNTEIQTLNHQYRKLDKPTNVLAFPSQLPTDLPLPRRLLGDLVIAPDVLFEEHLQLQKPLDAHWALIIIHGVLHLLGYLHEEEEETQRMQALETQLLAKFNFPNPYESS